VVSLEEYATHLEAAIQERTTDYLEEKRKTEELLYELLPRHVYRSHHRLPRGEEEDG
jgi:hypothetical protein